MKHTSLSPASLFLQIFFLGLFLFCVQSASLASGLTYTKIGEKFSAELENPPAATKTEWVLSAKGDIIKTSHASKFSYTFKNIGEFSLRATTEDANKNRETTVFEVFAVTKLPNFQVLASKITTLPETKNGKIYLSGEKGEEATVIFSFAESSGEIETYELDVNIFEDSDANGEISDDVDNKNDPSYLTGGTFSHAYKNTGIPARARLTVIDKEGNREESFVLITFPHNPENSEETTNTEDFPESATPEEQLEFITQQKALQDQKNNLTSPENSGTITTPSGATLLRPVLFASRSEILEGQTATFEIYSAPENSKYSWDFDGDGIFEIEEGSETKVTYKYANAGIFAVEVWILEAGKEAVIQKREISVRENFRAEIKTQNPIAHFAPEISGNTVYFSSSQSSADENMFNTDISYSWDFGDGFKTEGSNPEHIYKETGKYTVRLEVEDSLERSTVFSEEISIEEITNEFSADQHGGIQNTETPEISDTQGSVTLTDKDLTDAPDENSSGNSSEENEENNTSPENSGSYAWIWWILILIILIPLIVLIPLLKMKIDDPDKDFSVIFSDFFSGRKKKKTGEDEGGNNDEEQGDDKSNNKSNNKDDDKNDDKGRDKSTPLQNTANTATFVDEKIEEQENIRQTIENTESSDIFSGDALGEESNSPENSEDSTPDWMKSYDEESEEKAIEIPETTPIAPIPTPENPNETIPDWLQGGDSPFSDDLPDENLEISETPVAESINLPETSISEEKTPVISTPVKNSDDDIPDWLKADDDEVTPEAEVKTEDVKKEINNKNKEINTVNKRFDKSETLQENSKNPEISESPFSDFDHPEWLNEIKGNEDIQKNIVTETIQAEASSDDDIPDWLKGDDDIISPDSGKTEEVDVDTKNKELDNENKGLDKSEPLQENSEISPVKKKRKRRKKKKPDSKNPENTEKGDHKGTPLPEISTTEENSNENLPDWLKPDTEEISENTSEIPPVKKRRKRRKKKKTPEEIPAIREEIVTPEKILAKDAKIPRQQDDTSEVPEWLKG